MCTVCQNVVRDPLSCSSCELIVCKVCADREFKGKNCGVCSNPWTSQELHSYMTKMLEKITFSCKKCETVFPYSKHETHLTKECPAFSHYKCNADDCPDSDKKFTTIEALMDQHWKVDCLSVLKKCETCQEPLHNPLMLFEGEHDCVKAL